MKKEYLLSLVVLLLCFAGFEAVLHALDYPKAVRSGWRYRWDQTETNQLGYRGRKIEYSKDDYVILLVGDSQVESASNPLEEMPERLLEMELGRDFGNVKVFSIGTAGYGQDLELLALEEYYAKFRADAVVLWFTFYNDIWNNVFPTHNLDGSNSGPKPTWRLEHGRLIGPTESLRGVTDRWKTRALIRTALGYNRDDAWEKYLPPAYSPLESWEGKANPLWQDKNFRENPVREKSHLAPLLAPASPRMDYGIELTRALLLKIKGLVESKGGVFLSILPEHPYRKYLDSELPTIRTIAETYYQGDQVYEWQGKFYKTSKAQAEENLSRIMKDVPFYRFPVDLEGCTLSSTDFHFTTLANRFAMSELAGVLRDRVFPSLAPENLKRATLPVLQEKKTILFYEPLPEDVFAMGLGNREEWGQWSLGREVRIDLKEALPRRFRVTLQALAFGQSGAPFTLTVGDATGSFVLEDGQFTLASVDFQLEEDEVSSLTIEVPNPVSPESLGQGGDPRTLGIGLRFMEVEPPEYFSEERSD